jgi:predicted PurR-regulated permease PerM
MESQRIQAYFFLILFVSVLVLTGFIFLPFVAPVALAAMLAVVLRPVHRFIERFYLLSLFLRFLR